MSEVVFKDGGKWEPSLKSAEVSGTDIMFRVGGSDKRVFVSHDSIRSVQFGSNVNVVHNEKK